MIQLTNNIKINKILSKNMLTKRDLSHIIKTSKEREKKTKKTKRFVLKKI